MFYYLDDVCSEIKYKTIHKEIRSELQSHIDEFAEQYGEIYGDSAREIAARSMGDAKALGEMINKQYPMPFNSRLGLIIWAGLNTILGWTLYPFWITVWKHHTSVATPAALIVFLYCILNVFYLRRTHFKCSFRDWGHIALGTLIGTVLSVTVLLLISKMELYGHYIYGSRCLIPYKWRPWNYEMPMLFFFFWACWIIYMVSLGKPKGKKLFKVMPYVLPNKALDAANGEFYNVYGDKKKYSDIVEYGTAMRSMLPQNGAAPISEWRSEYEERCEKKRFKGRKNNGKG